MLTGAEILVKALEKENVEVVFCYPGGANLEILDCLYALNKIELEGGVLHYVG